MDHRRPDLISTPFMFFILLVGAIIYPCDKACEAAGCNLPKQEDPYAHCNPATKAGCEFEREYGIGTGL